MPDERVHFVVHPPEPTTVHVQSKSGDIYTLLLHVHVRDVREQIGQLNKGMPVFVVNAEFSLEMEKGKT